MQQMQPTNLEHPSQAMQWAGLIIVTLLTLATLTLPIIAAYVTKNAYYLIPAIGTIPLSFMWQRVANFLYKRKEDYDLDALKIKTNALNRLTERRK